MWLSLYSWPVGEGQNQRSLPLIGGSDRTLTQATAVQNQSIDMSSTVWIFALNNTHSPLQILGMLPGIFNELSIIYNTVILYYEDGNVFFREQLLVAGFETLIQPYRDHYYLLVPRLAALIAWFFPASIAPHVLNGAGVIVAALSCALFSMSRFRIIVRGDAARVLLCILFAVSLDSREVLASAANCLWPVGTRV
jgi:hypothetical protein